MNWMGNTNYKQKFSNNIIQVFQFIQSNRCVKLITTDDGKRFAKKTQHIFSNISILKDITYRHSKVLLLFEKVTDLIRCYNRLKKCKGVFTNCIDGLSLVIQKILFVSQEKRNQSRYQGNQMRQKYKTMKKKHKQRENLNCTEKYYKGNDRWYNSIRLLTKKKENSWKVQSNKNQKDRRVFETCNFKKIKKLI